MGSIAVVEGWMFQAPEIVHACVTGAPKSPSGVQSSPGHGDRHNKALTKMIAVIDYLAFLIYRYLQ